MSVGMLCLGKHWNGLTYACDQRRSDHDSLPVPPLPAHFVEIVRAAAHDSGFEMQPDLCIMNLHALRP
jgi:alkylated DNA repair dioxygenase AlkB